MVASKIYATEEIIEDGVNGYLCNLENEDEFIEKLNLLINDDSHYNYIKNNAKIFFDKSNFLEMAINEINKKIIWNFKDR